jgi:nucleoside-diphosphate kinase
MVIGEVVRRFEAAGIRIAAMKMLSLTKQEAQGFYAVHRERPFFDSLTDFMSSGPIVVMVLEGENVIARNRDLMGATDPKKAAAGTIRASFADGIEQNIVHGSDAPETAAVEIRYFFSELEIVA